jgi:hypothetical protein
MIVQSTSAMQYAMQLEQSEVMYLNASKEHSMHAI